MKKELLAGALLLPTLLMGGVEDDHLKLYASFDNGVTPEIARDGVGVREAGTIPATAGKFGNALRFHAADKPGDLLYDLGKSLNPQEWTIAFWARVDEPVQYGGSGAGRYFFRSNLGWMDGNAMAGFDNWGKCNFSHFDGAKKSCDTSVGTGAFPVGKWQHLAFVFNHGKHALYINGNEANYLNNQPATLEPPLMTVLRVGSMDYRSNDQLNGAIDEFKVFDKALAPEEIAGVMESVPGLKKKVTTRLYLPFEGNPEGNGISQVAAAELLFPAARFGQGVKIVRHGYDRRGVLQFQTAPHGAEALSLLLYFQPDWNGAEDRAVHGLLSVNAGALGYELFKEGDELVFRLRSGEETQTVSLRSALLARGASHRIQAGFDFAARKLMIAVDGQVREVPLTLAPPAGAATAAFRLGDTAAGDTYSATQAEGVLDELLIVDGYLPAKELDRIHRGERQRAVAATGVTLTPSPATPREKALWDLNGAEQIRTATRQRIALNALWRCQLTDAKRPFRPDDWLYLAVPGRFSGQGNGMADCEFYLRGKDGNKLAPDARYDGRSPYEFRNGWFERAFVADPAWRGRQVLLAIDELSRSQQGEVYLNGQLLAKLERAGRWFEIPIPAERLRFGEENFLTIHTEDDGQYWAWRGIKGNVALEIRNPVFAEFPAVVTSVKNRTVEFSATLRNRSGKPEELRLDGVVTGPDAPRAAQSAWVRLAPGESRVVRFSVPWANAKLWSPETPQLYHAVFAVRNRDGKLLDESEPVRFGFREFEIRGRDFYLNGKKIHLFNHDGWVNGSADLAEARRVARTLKKLGYNAVRTNFPVEAKDSSVDNIMTVCDEEGLLQFVGVDGVSGAEYALWSDPAVRAGLEKRMSAMIRRWRNSPSHVLYFLSVNFLGYGWDYHPLKMADGYQPESVKRKYRTCMEAVKILHRYDTSRPYFFQAGGNFGDVITSNAYFCWWPQAERNAWPQEWSKIGKKPLLVIETGFPYDRSFYGMDLKYEGDKPLFYLENLARYEGPAAYLTGDEEMLRAVAESTRGKWAPIWYDAPDFQRLKSRLLTETIPHWRNFDMSGICPFSEISFAFERNAPHRSMHSPKRWEVPAEEFRKFGWTPDARKITYQSDMRHDKPLPVAHALAEAMAPRRMMIDGGAAEPVDRTHHYYAGETLNKRIVLFNDTQSAAVIRGRWSLGSEHGAFEQTVPPGGIVRVPVALKLPAVEAATELPFAVTSDMPEIAVPRPLPVTVWPRRQEAIDGVAIYDPVGKTARKMRESGISARPVKSLDSLDGIRLLAVGTESLTPEFMREARRLKLADAVQSGKINVVVFAQKPEALALLGIRAMPIYGRDYFAGPTAGFLRAKHFSDWAGNGTLAPEKPLPAPETEDRIASPLWHWNNANIVASYPAVRPSEGAFDVLLAGGKDLIYTPLFSIKSGKGTVVFCQLEIANRTQADPAADATLVDLLRRFARQEPAAEPRAVVESGSKAEILAAVANGATAILAAGRAPEFGLTVRPQSVSRFTVTDAGRGYWGMLTARDLYWRAPQAVAVISGAGATPLTQPAFAVEKSFGKGKILFLGFPDDPQREERERGLKQGEDSSAVWSAELVANRFRQMRALAESACGKAETGRLADRFEAMYLPERMISLNGDWQFRADPRKEGIAQRWFTAGPADWRSCRIPGYYNNLLPEMGTEPGIFWYRRTVELPPDMRGEGLYLELGAVDDLDRCYVNGVEVGATGEDTEGYWEHRRSYPIPAALTRTGKLTVAIRVENLRGNGGVTDYARIVRRSGAAQRSLFPYTHNRATYHTESHVRW